jgi:hypothetical protein
MPHKGFQTRFSKQETLQIKAKVNEYIKREEKIDYAHIARELENGRTAACIWQHYTRVILKKRRSRREQGQPASKVKKEKTIDNMRLTIKIGTMSKQVVMMPLRKKTRSVVQEPSSNSCNTRRFTGLSNKHIYFLLHNT